MYFVYILQSLKDRKTYVGYTRDLTARFNKHNSGQVIATKYRRPLKLLFSEEFKTKQGAKRKELWWKSGAGRRKLQKFFNSKMEIEI